MDPPSKLSPRSADTGRSSWSGTRNNGTRAKVWLPQTEGQTAALTQDVSANTLALKDES